MSTLYNIPIGTKVRVPSIFREGVITEVEYSGVEDANYYWVAFSPYYSVLCSEDELEIIE